MANELLLETYLKQLRLPGFLANYQKLAVDAATSNLSYERYLLAMVETEVARRDQSRLQRSIRQAHFPVLKELSDYDFSAVASLPKLKVLELAQCNYLLKAETILMVGNPGLGKSHLATALALAACRQGKRVRFYTAAGLVNDLIQAHQEQRLSRFIAAALKQHLIVLDEFGFIPFSPQGSQLLFQFCSALYERVAMILTTNLSFSDWSKVLAGDERMSAALLDRLTHKAHILEFVGESFRFKQRMQREEKAKEPEN